MKSFYKAPIFLCAILLPTLSYAQSNYKPGYVIDLKGDTVNGFIDYREWDLNPDNINFKININGGAVQKFAPNDISYFAVNNLTEYRSYTGNISTDDVDPMHISSGRDTSFKVANIFLKVLQKGKNVSLYSYYDRYKKRFYIADNLSRQPKELVYRLYINPDPESLSQKTITENAFRKQLFVLAEQSGVMNSDLQNAIQRAEYHATDILSIVSRINNVSGAEYKKENNDKNRVTFFAGTGVNRTDINPFDQYKSAGAKSTASYLPVVVIGANLLTSPNTGRLVFRTELMISGSHFNSQYIYTGSPYVPVHYSYNQIWAAFAPQIVYNIYNTTNVKLHLNLGIAITYYDYYKANYDLNYALTKVSNAPFGSDFFNKTAFPILIKGGIKVRRIDLFAGYITNNMISDDHYFQLHTSNMQFGINYFLN
jgi:hypothetical protein